MFDVVKSISIVIRARSRINLVLDTIYVYNTSNIYDFLIGSTMLLSLDDIEHLVKKFGVKFYHYYFCN